MDKIVPAFETTLFDSTLSDACIDMGDRRKFCVKAE